MTIQEPMPAPAVTLPLPEPFPRYPKALRDAERACLAHRYPGEPEPAPGKEGWPWKHKVGLALSGGGIRSATFSLGILQALAAPAADEEGQPRLAAIDILSTVSGGGYIGSFLGGLFQWRNAGRDKHKVDEEGRSFEEAMRDLRDLHSPPLRFLRENGRYLTPGGSGDALRAAAVAGRNFVAVHLVMATFALLVFLLLDLAATSSTRLGLPWRATYALWGFAISGWVVLPLLAALLVVVPTAWAYWMAGSVGWKKASFPPWFMVAVLGAGGLLAFLVARSSAAPLLGILGPHGPVILGFLALEACLALAWMGVAKAAGAYNRRSAAQADEAAEFSPRRRLTSILRWSFLIVLLGLFLTLVDTFALAVFKRVDHAPWHKGLSASAAAVAGLVARTQAIRSFFTRKLKAAGAKGQVPWTFLADLLAFLIATGMLVALAYLAHGLGSAWGPIEDQTLARLGWCAIVALALSLAFGRTFPFLNQSSLSPFYTTMLTRAYLGASNGLRHAQVESVDYVVDGDDLLWTNYRPHEHLGPLHLINVCLNETEGGESQVTQRDRKGMAMAVGPAGVSVGVRHHALWHQDLPQGEGDVFGVFQVDRPKVPFNPEGLTVGQWMGISGAAVGTGMGHTTSRSLAFLFGILNARLGHWWDGGVPPRRRRGGPTRIKWFRPMRTAFSVQFHLLDEFLASFPGTSTQRWFLSDGGHFENLAVYELLRRRLPFIIAVDASADPESQLGDLENLVRLARVDLDADIRFLSREELEKDDSFGKGVTGAGLLGPLEWLKRGHWEGDTPPPADWTGFSRCHACIAKVIYRDPSPTAGWLLYLKPTLLKPGQGAADVPLDVQKYHEHHPAFPHESTGDQFFDEAQWESYRRLGEHIGVRILQAGTVQGPFSIWDFCARAPKPTCH